MKTITSQNLLEFLRVYFASLGLGYEASQHFTAKRFSGGLVMKLPMVCIVKKNRPSGTPGNQTHIHVTGDNRYFFFSAEDIRGAEGSTDDVRQEIIVSEANIRKLNGKNYSGRDLGLKKTHTMLKLGHGAGKQVQISKLRLDGHDFIDLRNGLYENDLLVFLRYSDCDRMMAIGVPKSFYAGSYKFDRDLFPRLESNDAIPVKNALSLVMDEYEDTDVVSSDGLIADAVYQELVDAAKPGKTSYEPVKYNPSHPEGKDVKNNRPATNPAVGKEAIKDADYKCSVDGAHITFIKKDGTPYMEVHHLIPLEQQGKFEYKLDTKANLVPLCPLCHKLIHYGRMEDKKPILTRLYNERKEALKKSGLDITPENLNQYYV